MVTAPRVSSLKMVPNDPSPPPLVVVPKKLPSDAWMSEADGEAPSSRERLKEWSARDFAGIAHVKDRSEAQSAAADCRAVELAIRALDQPGRGNAAVGAREGVKRLEGSGRIDAESGSFRKTLRRTP